MFEINDDIDIKKIIIDDSVVYVADDFYLHPDKIVQYLLSHKPPVHKKNDQPSYNQIYFDDRRHWLRTPEIKKVYKFLGSLCQQSPKVDNDLVVSNFTRFFTSKFNDYQNNYWWPHIDAGYTAIVYFTDDNQSGTNLYERIKERKDYDKFPEHYKPWRDKNDYKIITTLESSFNRMILFDGLKFYHGMNIPNEKYFGEQYRINQVFFFKQS